MQHEDARESEAGSYPDAGTFARIATEFEALRVAAPRARLVRLAELAAAEPGLAEELRRLLAWHETEDGALARPERALDAELLAAAMAEPLPERVGPYRLLQPLGHGGMGSVYRAERADGEFQQTVAVKLLQPGAARPELQQRFRTERRILASLRHPNIAALLDGGTSADGRAYVVMECIDGDDLMTHAERRGLSLSARLELFIKVCGAVEHAHHHLVVHRDLKPANILVTPAGEPKLLDFGIAKLLQGEPGGDTDTPTVTGAMLLTPEYASPEQVRGESITTATDVYALGMILHELLTVQRAQTFTTRTPRELEEVVCERKTPPPSQVIAAAGARLPAMGVPRARLRRLLAGDLDVITQRACHKDPARRYGSAAALADDLRRHLQGLPVHARPDTFAYLARKFLGRHRWPMAAAAAFVLVLVAATVVTAAMARTASRQRDVAERKSLVAEQVSNFLVELFKMAEPDPVRAEQLSARALLDRGSKRIAGELRDAPLVRASLQDAMGRAYTMLGLFQQARPLLDEALATRRAQGAEPSAVRDSLLHLGALLAATSQLEPAEATLRQSLALAQEAGDLHAATEARMQLTALLDDAGRGEEALQLAQQVIATLDAEPQPPDHHKSEALMHLGNVQRNLGMFDPALATLRQALSLQQQLYGQDSPMTSDIQRALGNTEKERGDYPAAKAALQQALDQDTAFLGDTHPDVKADMFAMAMLEDDLGDPEEAERLLQRVLEQDRRTFGEVHPYVALDLGQLAAIRSRRGDTDGAEPLLLQALAMQRKTLPSDHPEIATTLNNLAVLYQQTDRLDDAEKCSREALAIRERIFPPDHPALLTSRNILAVIEQDRGNSAAAERQFRAVLEVRKQKLGDHPDTAGSYYSLAVSVARQGRLPEAEQLARESLRIYQARLDPQHLDLSRPLQFLGRMLMERGDAAAAEPMLRQAVTCRQLHLDGNHPLLISAECDLGRCLLRLGRLDEAAPVLQQALERCKAGGVLEGTLGKRVQEALQDLQLARQRGR